MIRRKKSTTGRNPRKRREDSASPTREPDQDEVVQVPPEFTPYDYDRRAPYLVRCLNGQHYPFLSTGFVRNLNTSGNETPFQIQLIHELEEMLAANQANRDQISGEIKYMTDGQYPTTDFKDRLMPVYDIKEDENPIQEEEQEAQSSESRSQRASSVHNVEEPRDNEICKLPEDGEDDDFDEYPAYHVGTRFWTWCRKSFMGKIDAQFLESFKEVIMDPYSDEALQKYFVNEPWKYRTKRAVPTTSSRRKSLNTSTSKKKVSISNDVVSPQNGVKNGTRKSSLSGYRIPNRRTSEKERESLNNNNNKIMPIIESMVMSAQKDNRSLPETPTTRRGRSRMTSPEYSRERKMAKLEVDTESEDDDELLNGSAQLGTPRLHSPRSVKKEKVDEGYERMENGNGHSSTNGMNGHSKRLISPKRKNGDIRSYFNSSSKPSTSTSNHMNGDIGGTDEPQIPKLEDVDLISLGSNIVEKLIAKGFLDESSAQIFQKLTSEEDEEEASMRVEMSEEGKDEAEEQEVGELAEQIRTLQLGLKEQVTTHKALLALTWERAKAHFAFFHTFNEMKRADYDLFKLGVNMYRDFPNRKLPGISETMLLKLSLKKRNQLARIHYSKMYRRHPKYRWHRGYNMGRRLIA